MIITRIMGTPERKLVKNDFQRGRGNCIAASFSPFHTFYEDIFLGIRERRLQQ